MMKSVIKCYGDTIKKAQNAEKHRIPLPPVLYTAVVHYEPQQEKEHHIHSDIQDRISHIGNFVMPCHGDTAVGYEGYEGGDKKTRDISLIRIIACAYHKDAYRIQHHKDCEKDHEGI